MQAVSLRFDLRQKSMNLSQEALGAQKERPPKSLISVVFPNLHLVSELLPPGIPLPGLLGVLLSAQAQGVLYCESYGQSNGAHSVHEAQVRLLPHPLFDNAWLKLIAINHTLAGVGGGRWFFSAESAELAGAGLKSEDTTATWTEASTGNEAGRAEF